MARIADDLAGQRDYVREMYRAWLDASLRGDDLDSYAEGAYSLQWMHLQHKIRRTTNSIASFTFAGTMALILFGGESVAIRTLMFLWLPITFLLMRNSVVLGHAPYKRELERMHIYERMLRERFLEEQLAAIDTASFDEVQTLKAIHIRWMMERPTNKFREDLYPLLLEAGHATAPLYATLRRWASLDKYELVDRWPNLSVGSMLEPPPLVTSASA